MKKFFGKFKEVSTGLVLSFTLSLLIFVFAPYELYLTNISEFWMSAGMLFPAVAILFAVSFLFFSFLFIAARLINKKLYHFSLVVAAAAAVGVYIQGNFLIKNLPSMSGETIDWNSYPAERLKSVLAFVIPFAVFIFLLLKFKDKLFKKILKIGSTCLSLLLVITLTTLFVTTDTKKGETLAPTVQNEFQLSEDKNFIVLVVDAFDTGYFRTELEKDSELKAELDGFTFFDNTLAAYPYTSHALPMIFSGKWYENEGSFSEYLTESVDKSPFMVSLEKQNYTIGLYEQCELNLKQSVFDGRFENCYQSQINYKNKYLYGLIIKMAGVKYAPWDLKSHCRYINEFTVRCRAPKSDYEIFTWSNTKFYNAIKTENPISVTNNKCARFIHIEGAHVPYKFDKDVNIISAKKGSYTQNVQASATIIKQYLKRLKESGVYDNSVIIIMGDHGYAGNDLYDEYNIKKRMNPVLLVKGVDEKHEMTYSSAPISYTDVAEGFARLVEGKKSNEIFEYSDGDARTRRALLFVYNNEKHITEYFTDGRADDPDALKASGKEYDLK